MSQNHLILDPKTLNDACPGYLDENDLDFTASQTAALVRSGNYTMSPEAQREMSRFVRSSIAFYENTMEVLEGIANARKTES